MGERGDRLVLESDGVGLTALNPMMTDEELDDLVETQRRRVNRTEHGTLHAGSPLRLRGTLPFARSAMSNRRRGRGMRPQRGMTAPPPFPPQTGGLWRGRGRSTMRAPPAPTQQAI